jgi:hypothetical protein
MPMQNGLVERLIGGVVLVNSRLGDECVDVNLFNSLDHAR